MIRKILKEYIQPSYPKALEWYDNLSSQYSVIPLKHKDMVVGLAITRGIKLCTFVILKECRNRGFGTHFIRRLNVKYVKSKNEKLKYFFKKNGIMFILDKRRG